MSNKRTAFLMLFAWWARFGAPFLNAFVVIEIGFVQKMRGAERWLYVSVRAWRALAVFLTAEMTALQNGAINAMLFL